MDKVLEKKSEEAPSIKVETSRTNVLHNSVDSKSALNDTPVVTRDIAGATAKDNTSDTTKDATSDALKDTTSDTSKDITSSTTKVTTNDATKRTTSNTTKDTTSDKTKDITSDTTTVNNVETVQSEAAAKDMAMDSISDITDDTVTNKAWLDGGKPDNIVITSADKHSGSEESPTNDKNKIDKLDIKDEMEEVDNDDVFELPTHLRKSSQFPPGSPISPNMSPRLSVGRCSPVNMSPRPGRRSSFVSQPSCMHPCRNIHSTLGLRQLIVCRHNLFTST